MAETDKSISRPDLWDGRQGDHAFRNAISDMFAFAFGMNTLRRSFGGLSGLGTTGFGIVLAIWQIDRLGEKAGINAIAEHMHLAAAHITGEVNKLTAAGMVTKQVDESDGRAVKLTLTALGENLLDSIMPVMRAVNDRLFDGITRDEIMTLAALCRKIAKATGEAQSVLREPSQ